MRKKKIVILTSHVFLQGYRKASIHFVAQNWARQGHAVHFLTVGHSRLSGVKQPDRYRALRREQANRFTKVDANLFAGAHLPVLHAFSTGKALVNRLMAPLFRLYGSSLPAFVTEHIRQADLVVLESGTPLAFFPAVKKLNPAARTLYFCRDLLRSVGAAPVLQDIERETIGIFDRVCVPSRHLGKLLPPGGKIAFVPQGVDRAMFDSAITSPYPAGSFNAVAVGDMLFDRASIDRMATAAPEVTFHLFGVRWTGAVPDNIRVYGEQAFETVVPFIRHADIGLAPYRLTPDDVYLAESSLKLLQYSQCLLPVILPEIIPVHRGNEITYRPGEASGWREKIDRALTLPRSNTFRDGILTWEQVAEKTLAVAFDPD
jgi:2-beta-glucuronyltransferase